MLEMNSTIRVGTRVPVAMVTAAEAETDLFYRVYTVPGCTSWTLDRVPQPQY